MRMRWISEKVLKKESKLFSIRHLRKINSIIIELII
jgi:hypothetical protein